MNECSAFIWQHRLHDPAQLALSGKKRPEMPMAYIARQVEALQKIHKKIPHWYREGMEFPVALSIEQASSEATARFKAGLFTFDKGADLSGGLGVDACFLSAGAVSYDFVEKDPEILRAARQNLGILGVKNLHFHEQTAEVFLQQAADNYDLIYLDPARRNARGGKLFHLSDCSPNVLEIKNLILKKSKKLLLKTAPFLDISLAMEQLRQVSAVWVLEYEGDCRELLFLMENKVQQEGETVPIQAVGLNENGTAAYRFQASRKEESEAIVSFSPPMRYLVEPPAAILKAGFFKTFGDKFGLHKLHIHTHLYTADRLPEQLPGRHFQVRQICRYDKKEVAAALPDGKAHVATRNFPDGSDQVRRKLGLRDGGDTYVFATTDVQDKKLILICNKA